MKRLKQYISTVRERYLPLIKPLQTGLLLVTGMAGFMSAKCPWKNPLTLLAVAGSLFLAISGSTILNMWFDRDIDEQMGRTTNRPIPAGVVSAPEALRIGLLLSVLGVGWAALMDGLYGLVVFAGLFFDVVVYTLWLKRRSAWSIVFGGISGGMPILAGRAYGLGYIDWVGVLFAFSILFWIPTHILTFSIRNRKDYQRAGIPTFVSVYGIPATKKIISFSTVLAAVGITVGALGVGMTTGCFHIIWTLSAVLFALSVVYFVKPSDKVGFFLYKYASVFMLANMILIIWVGY